MQNLYQTFLQRRSLSFIDYFFYICQQVIKRISLLNRFVDIVHHPPVKLHCFLQLVLQSRNIIVNALDLTLHFGLHVDADLLLCLATGLPLLLLPLNSVLGREQVQIHLVSATTLPIQYPLPLAVTGIVPEIVGPITIRVPIEPLQEYDVILKHPLCHLLEGGRLGYFQFLQSILHYLQISQIVLRVSRAEVQPGDSDRSGVNCIEHLSVGYPVGQRLNAHVICLYCYVDPSQQICLAQIHIF